MIRQCDKQNRSDHVAQSYNNKIEPVSAHADRFITTVDLALKPHHTARHTRVLHSMPLVRSGMKPAVIFAAAAPVIAPKVASL